MHFKNSGTAMMHLNTSLVLTVAVFAFDSSFLSADVVFFGEDINMTATGENEDAVRIEHPNSDQAYAGFMQLLSDVQTEDFESFDGNEVVVEFGTDDTVTLNPGLTVLDIPFGTFNGVYPISGDKCLLQSINASDTFTMGFSSPQAAFGFYMTDVEIDGNLELQFLLSDGTTIITRPVPTQAGSTGTNVTGSVAFFGVVDIENPFISVTFFRTLNSSDGFGFDDVTIGRVDDVSFLSGDVNQDSFVNLLDVAPFVDLLSNGDFQAEADINGDGEVDLLDVAPFVELLSGG